MGTSHDDQSLGELLSKLSRETSVLVRKEVELATAEMTAKAQKFAVDAGMTAAGGALAHAGVLVLLAAIVLGLTQLGVTPWLSALIVAVLTIGVGYLLVTKALTNMRRTSPMPTQTVETLKETAKWTTRRRGLDRPNGGAKSDGRQRV
jgi:hypothetical protein